MSLLSWFCTHKYSRWKPASKSNHPKRRAEEEFSLDCMWVRICVYCGKSDHKYVHDIGPEKFRRTFDDGNGEEVEISYQKCLRCGEEVMIAPHSGVE